MGRDVVLFDTHAFVWWVASRARVSAKAKRAIEKARRRLLSDISLWEIAKLVSLGRLKLDRDVEGWLAQAVEAAGVEVVGIDPQIAARSTRLAANFHGDPADQLIAATSIVTESTLITADENLLASSAVDTLW